MTEFQASPDFKDYMRSCRIRKGWIEAAPNLWWVDQNKKKKQQHKMQFMYDDLKTDVRFYYYEFKGAYGGTNITEIHPSSANHKTDDLDEKNISLIFDFAMKDIRSQRKAIEDKRAHNEAMKLKYAHRKKKTK